MKPRNLARADVGRRAGVIAIALLVGGCGTQPEAPERADAPLPDTFTEAGEQERPGQWWHHFDDPALNRVVSSALDDNFSLAAARNRLAQARAAARRSAGGELPRIDANAAASERNTDDGSESDYRIGAMAAYELDLWGRLDAQTRAAELEADATRRDLQAARISLSAEAAGTYYSLRREQALEDLLREQRRINRRILELVELRFGNGQATADEVLRQRQLIEETKTQLAEIRGDIERLRAELAALQGLPGPATLDLPEAQGPPELAPLPRTGMPADWLRRRPDLEAAFLRVRAADAELAAAIAERYPSLDLTASLETAATSPSNLFRDWIAEIAASLAVPLFRGGQIEAEVDRTESARAEAFNEYAQAVLDAVAAVETALANERSQRQRLASLERRVRQGEDVLGQLRYRYGQGSAGFIEVLRAQDDLQTDQRQRIETQWALVNARITLLRELAGAWQPNESERESS